MAKKKKSAFFIVPLDVFEFDIIVSCGQSNDELLKSLQKVKGGKKHLIEEFKYNIENPPAGADAYCIVLQSGCTVLRALEYPENSRDYGVMMHEVFHAVSCPFRNRGIKLSSGSEESYAYAIGYVSTQIFKQLWK